jgi:pilus assembly protein CpaB
MSKLTRRSVVLAALCAGLLAALLTLLFLEREKARAAERTGRVQVVVAAQDVPVRMVIEPGMVREDMRPVGTLPPNCATSVQEVVGRVTLTALAVDEPVQRAAVAQRTAALGLAYVVPKGMRAVTVGVDPIIGVAGFLKAGDHVDVLATFTVDKTSLTKTVLQDVELLAIGPEVRPEEVNQPRSERAAKPREQTNATLAVTPQQAETLTLAESEGTLRLALRPAGDEVWVGLTGERSDALIGLRPASTAAAPAPRPQATAPPASYTSPWFVGGSARSGAGFPSLGSGSASAGESEAATAASVETIRGTRKTTVEVRPE